MARRAGAREEVTARVAGGGTPGGGEPPTTRARIALHGIVQGVGFRPFVYNLATSMRLRGWVTNSPQGVCIEIEGERPALERFRQRLEAEKPAHAAIHGLELSWLDPAGYAGFEIRPSDVQGERRTLVLPDLATCSDCRREIFDPRDRRYLYPFTNCTHCGPRFSIIESLPYDRARTSMKQFEMCPSCRAEYEDPANRRFHAQPNACPDCGPELALWDAEGRVVEERHEALLGAAAALRRGEIVALKGLGGFQLLCDARDEAAVRRLRARKHREEKPLAVLGPDLDSVRTACRVSAEEETALLSAASPIVLLQRIDAAAPVLAPSVAPRNPYLGVMLPYTPLHHLLTSELGFPVVATSGNLSEEPICTDEKEALERLRGIADFFLVHDRPIVRHVDDSVVRVLLGRELVLRRARGYAPLPIPLRGARGAILAVGAHLKNTVALAFDDNVFLSQHVGDLENPAAVAAFEQAIASLRSLYPGTLERVATDAHPDYYSTRHGQGLGLPVVTVQHHMAHVAACMAENDLDEPVLGVAWDGTGYGPDGTVWGGEFLRAADGGFERVATLLPFQLPGGEQAVREPRRSALGVLFAMFGSAVLERRDLPVLHDFEPADLRVLLRMLERGINSPVTTSAGRLFDAVAALCGLRQETHFEGQSAMELEFAIDESGTDSPYPIALRPNPDTNRQADRGWAPRWVVDWKPTVGAVLADRKRNAPTSTIARRFHLALVSGIVEVARAAGEPRIVLSGGCFQNVFLTQHAVRALESAGFRVYWHQRVPPNDGGIALGQVAVAARSIVRRSSA